MARIGGLELLVGLNLLVSGGFVAWLGWGAVSDGPIYLDETQDEVEGDLSIQGQLGCQECIRSTGIQNGTIDPSDLSQETLSIHGALLGSSVMSGLSIDERTKFYHPNGATSRHGEEIPMVVPRDGTLTNLHTHLVTNPESAAPRDTEGNGTANEDANSTARDDTLRQDETLTITVRVDQQDTELETVMTPGGGVVAEPGFRIWNSSASIPVEQGDLVTIRAHASDSLEGIAYGWSFEFQPNSR